jgi:hypothetical protein
MPTVTRMARIQALPPMTPGWRVIRSKSRMMHRVIQAGSLPSGWARFKIFSSEASLIRHRPVYRSEARFNNSAECALF